MSPRPGETIRWAGVAALCAGSTRVVMTTASIVVMVRPSLCAQSDQTKCCRCSRENTHHGFPYWGEIAPCDQEAANVWALKSAERRGLPAFFSSEGFAGFSKPTPKPGGLVFGAIGEGVCFFKLGVSAFAEIGIGSSS
jgi:hypothetical protein